MSVVGGYTLDLYCDNADDAGISHYRAESGLYVLHQRVEDQFAGNTFADTSRQAKTYGWKLSSDRRFALCPVCVKNGMKLKMFTDACK